MSKQSFQNLCVLQQKDSEKRHFQTLQRIQKILSYLEVNRLLFRKLYKTKISKNSTEINVFYDSRKYPLTIDPIIKRFEEILQCKRSLNDHRGRNNWIVRSLEYSSFVQICRSFLNIELIIYSAEPNTSFLLKKFSSFSICSKRAF